MTKGWKFESARHSLARKGIETGKKGNTISQKYHTKVNAKNVVDYIIGFEGDEEFPDYKEIDLFSYLLKTGQVWHMQGMYGREAESLIEAGYLKKDGTILKYPPKESKELGRYEMIW